MRKLLKTTGVFRRAPKFDVLRHGRTGYLSCADALEFTSSLADGIADLVFLDPPFNLGKNYGKYCDLERAAPDDYEEYLIDLIRDCHRIMAPGGAIFLYHLPYWATRLSVPLNAHFTFRHWIAVAMKNGFVRGERLYPAHYALLYYTKGDPSFFHRPKLRPETCRSCGEYIKSYGGYRKIIDKKGINLSDFWDDISPVRHPSKKRRVANELPRRLTDRIVSIAGGKDGLIVDPFCGAGSMLASANDCKMRFLGNDFSEENLEVCLSRLNEPNGKIVFEAQKALA